MKLAMKMPLDNYGTCLRVFGDWIKVKAGAGIWCMTSSKFGAWNTIQSLTGSDQRTKSETNGMRKTSTIDSKAMSSIP